MSTMWLWLKEKWKITLAAILGLLGILSVFLRLRAQKAVLQKANESHEKDNKLNDDAIKDLSEGMGKINSETVEALESAREKHDKVESDLEKEKKEFVKEVSEGDDLARKLAEELGAKYVEKD